MIRHISAEKKKQAHNQGELGANHEEILYIGYKLIAICSFQTDVTSCCTGQFSEYIASTAQLDFQVMNGVFSAQLHEAERTVVLFPSLTVSCGSGEGWGAV